MYTPRTFGFTFGTAKLAKGGLKRMRLSWVFGRRELPSMPRLWPIFLRWHCLPSGWNLNHALKRWCYVTGFVIQWDRSYWVQVALILEGGNVINERTQFLILIKRVLRNVLHSWLSISNRESWPVHMYFYFVKERMRVDGRLLVILNSATGLRWTCSSVKILVLYCA